MALSKCPECGREVSDQAISCPNCGAPISSSGIRDDHSDAKARGQFRSGAITGIIGAAFIILMLISFQWASTQGGAHDDADITFSVSGDDRMLPIAAIGLLCSAAAIVPFLIGAIKARTLKKNTAIALAATTLSISVVALLGMLLLYGAIAICGGWLFIWEPAVETIGAAKMLAASLRYTRP